MYIYIHIYTHIFYTSINIYLYLWKKEAINLKESNEEYMGGFGRRKVGNNVIM